VDYTGTVVLVKTLQTEIFCFKVHENYTYNTAQRKMYTIFYSVKYLY
jgi:hypothetical protein